MIILLTLQPVLRIRIRSICMFLPGMDPNPGGKEKRPFLKCFFSNFQIIQSNLKNNFF